MIKKIAIAVIIFSVVVIAIIAIGTSGSSPSSSSSTPAPQSTQPAEPDLILVQWWEGGTLHNATVTQWKSATYENKLATAGDWLSATKWEGHLKSTDDFDKLKLKSQMLVNAVDEVVNVIEESLAKSMNVTETAAAIIIMSNDLGP